MIALLGALCFSELATRHPRAGGKYVYAREAFGRRAAFVVGWIESVGVNGAAIAAIGVAAAEFLARLLAWPASRTPALGAALVALFTAINVVGVASGRWVQNVVTTAKVLALGGVVVIAFALGTGAGWHAALPGAPHGWSLVAAVAVASQPVMWTYYGYPDLAKIAEEVVDPSRTLPRIFVGGVAIALAATGTFELLIGLAIVLILVIDGLAIVALFRLRAREGAAPFSVPWYPIVPLLLHVVYGALLAGTAWAQPRVVGWALLELGVAYAAGRMMGVHRPGKR